MEPHFFSAEHVHVLLNHLPVIGLAMGILALVLALMHHSRKTEMVALILVLVAAASAWPINFTGQCAYKTVRGFADDAGADWLDTHMERAEKAAPAFYALALLTRRLDRSTQMAAHDSPARRRHARARAALRRRERLDRARGRTNPASRISQRTSAHRTP